MPCNKKRLPREITFEDVIIEPAEVVEGMVENVVMEMVNNREKENSWLQTSYLSFLSTKIFSRQIFLHTNFEQNGINFDKTP